MSAERDEWLLLARARAARLINLAHLGGVLMDRAASDGSGGCAQRSTGCLLLYARAHDSGNGERRRADAPRIMTRH